MEKEMCPICENEGLVSYITVQGKYVCCECCGFEYPEVDKNEV